MAMTDRERQRRRYDRMRAEGYRQVHMWVRPEDAHRIRTLADWLMSRSRRETAPAGRGE
jgi:hypothetical protein